MRRLTCGRPPPPAGAAVPPLDVEAPQPAGMPPGTPAGEGGGPPKADVGDGPAANGPPPAADVSYLDLVRYWLPLGWTTFGGPSAHVGQFMLVGGARGGQGGRRGRGVGGAPRPAPPTRPTPSNHSLPPFLQLFADRLNWFSKPVFAELMALAQCIPGPSSTQLAYGIGILKRGTLGGLISGEGVGVGWA